MIPVERSLGLPTPAALAPDLLAPDLQVATFFTESFRESTTLGFFGGGLAAGAADPITPSPAYEY